MGLDSQPSREPEHTVLTDEDREALAGLELHLCDQGSHGGFRGKVYEDLVLRVTGNEYSLYELWLSAEDLGRIAEAFEARDPEVLARATEADYYPATADEVRSLRRLFRLCADRGIGLYGDV